MLFVLDTNTLSYFFKGMGHVADNLLQTPPRRVALPAIVLYELEVGIAKSPAATHRRRQLDEIVRWITVLPFGAKEARVTALLRADLESRGIPIGPLDTMIAGTALIHRATLVTHNLREFTRVPDLPLADWYSEPPTNR